MDPAKQYSSFYAVAALLYNNGVRRVAQFEVLRGGLAPCLNENIEIHRRGMGGGGGKTKCSNIFTQAQAKASFARSHSLSSVIANTIEPIKERKKKEVNFLLQNEKVFPIIWQLFTFL